MRTSTFWLAVMVASALSCSSNPSTESTVPSEPVRKENRFFIEANQKAQDGLYKEAIQSYEQAIELEPRNLEVYKNLGIVYVRVGDYQKGVEHLRKSIRAFDDNFAANFYLAEAFRGLEKFDEAIFRYKRADQVRPKQPDVLRALAWSYFRVRYYSEALSTSNQLLSINANDGQVAIIKARTLLAMEQPKRALQLIRNAKRHANEDTLPYFHSVEGDILSAQGDCQLASKIYIEALKKQPLLAGSLLGLGRCHLQEGDNEKAIRYITRAARIKPRLKEAYYLLGKAHQGKDRRKAVKFFRRFYKVASSDPEYMNQIKDTKERLAELTTSK